MSRKTVVVDVNGERLLSDRDWPLTIGCLPGADIRVGGAVADGDVALIDSLDERPFLQSVGAVGGLTVNDEPVTSNRWLESGDIISVLGTEVSCVFDDEELRFAVPARSIDYPTLPPEIVSPDDGFAAADVTIEPI